MSNHPGSIDRPGTAWRVRMSFNGARKTWMLDPVEYPTEADVAEFARQEHRKLVREADRLRRGLPGRMRFSELVEKYRDEALPLLAPNSVKSYGTSLAAFETYFVTRGGDPLAHEISKGHISGFMSWRRTHAPDGTELKSPVTARTVAKDRMVLGIVFAFGESQEIIDSNPVRKTKAPEGDQRQPIIIDADQYEALLAACEGRPMLGLYALTLGELGVRCDSEALWLQWGDVDLESGFVTIVSGRDGHRSKSGKSRKVPMTPRLRQAMRDHFAAYRLRTYHNERTPWVFHHELDRRHAKAGTRLGGLRRAFAGAVKRAGLPEALNQHDLRHRRVTTWLDAGHPAHVVQLAMGHADIQTTLGYSHLTESSLKRLVEEPAVKELATGSEGI